MDADDGAVIAPQRVAELQLRRPRGVLLDAPA
jgi:hypothetical protein